MPCDPAVSEACCDYQHKQCRTADGFPVMVAGKPCACECHSAASAAVSDNVNHPSHYGGKDNPYEAIKVIEAWNLGFHLGNTVKYISRAEHKGNTLEDLKKARWYLDRFIEKLKGGK